MQIMSHKSYSVNSIVKRKKKLKINLPEWSAVFEVNEIFSGGSSKKMKYEILHPKLLVTC